MTLCSAVSFKANLISMGQLVLKMSAWQLSAHRRNPVFASRAGAIPEGGTTDQHVKRSSEPDSGSENNYDDNAQLASFISSNPALVLTQTSSMVDCSSNDITHKPEIPTSPPGSIQPLSDDHFWYRYKQCPEAETTYLLPNSQFLKDEPAACSELPALLVETLEMLAASHSQEVHDSTAFLAAAAMYENAFDIFQLTSDGIKIAPRWKLLANIYSRKDTTGSKATSTHSYEEDSF